MQEGLRNPAIVKRLRTRYAVKEIKEFAIAHGIYQETLSDLGMRPAAFRRAAALTGKQLPTVQDLLDWCKRRHTLDQGFEPKPGSTDAEIEGFAISQGHDNPALAFLNLGVRAITTLKALYHTEVPSLLDLKRLVAEHPVKSERDAWLVIQMDCGGKTIFDMEFVISNTPAIKTSPVSRPGTGDPSYL